MKTRNTDGPPKVLNPLWIISLFVSLTEVTLGYATSRTAGGIQISLTCFVITFPVLIAACFFYVLWHRPQHLYAPGDFGSDRSFLEAMRQTKRVLRQAQIETARE